MDSIRLMRNNWSVMSGTGFTKVIPADADICEAARSMVVGAEIGYSIDGAGYDYCIKPSDINDVSCKGGIVTITVIYTRPAGRHESVTETKYLKVTICDVHSGRPVGSGDGRTVTFRLRLTPEERAELDRCAEEAGQTPSQFVRTRIFEP